MSPRWKRSTFQSWPTHEASGTILRCRPVSHSVEQAVDFAFVIQQASVSRKAAAYGVLDALRFGAAGLRRLRSRASLAERGRRREMLQHGVRLRYPATTAVVVPDKEPEPGDVEIASRLLAAYRLASGGRQTSSDGRTDIWSAITARQGVFASVLAREDPDELARYLCNVSRRDGSEGITQGPGEFKRVTHDKAYRSFVALMVKDKLVSLAEALGAIPVENPEQGPYGVALYRDTGKLVDSIRDKIGISVTPPDIDGGLLKLDTGRGLFNDRDANAIYTAWLLRGILDAHPGRPRVCEIGGGSGRVAYWSNRLGLTSYTIVDLPHINVVQGYYLLKTLPPDRVSLYGERNPGEAGDRLEVLPAHAVDEIRGQTFDLVLNQDSFPEIDRETVAAYLEWIKATCKGRLVSINHECRTLRHDREPQLSVPEEIKASGGFTLTQRGPYWLRKGYVLELYAERQL